MATDLQVRMLMKLKTEKKWSLSASAAKSGMCARTARKYRRFGKLPSELSQPHTWRTRPDPFKAVFDEIAALLELNPGLEAKTLFADLQRRYPGPFQTRDSTKGVIIPP